MRKNHEKIYPILCCGTRSINFFVVLLIDFSNFPTTTSNSPKSDSQSFSELNPKFPPAAKDSSQRKKIPYICGLRARIECEPGGEHSTRSDRVTNIGYLLSLGASALPGPPELIQHLLENLINHRWVRFSFHRSHCLAYEESHSFLLTSFIVFYRLWIIGNDFFDYFS